MKNSKKGFTLIEIIVCVFLLSVIAVVSIVSLNKKDNSLTEQENAQKEFDNAISIATDKLESSGRFNSYDGYIDSNNLTNSFFCMTKESIINSGVIVQDNSILKNIADDEYIKVIKDTLGNYTYEFTTEENECSYLNSKIDNTGASFQPDLSNESEGYVLKPNICQKTSSDQTDCDTTSVVDDSVQNKYLFNLNFEYDFVKSVEIPIPDIYTVFIIDRSGSMDGTPYTNAKAAVKELSKTIVARNSGLNCNNSSVKCNYVSLITFSSSATLKRDFKTTDLSSVSFPSATGGTDYGDAFNEAYDLITGLGNKRADARIFVIFLTDGQDSGYSTNLTNLRNALIYNGKEIGKIISINYDSGAADNLKEIASSGCDVGGLLLAAYKSNGNKTSEKTGITLYIKNGASYTKFASSLTLFGVDSENRLVGKKSDGTVFKLDIDNTLYIKKSSSYKLFSTEHSTWINDNKISSLENKCYFKYSSSDIYEKFSELYTTIESEAILSVYKKIEITINTSENFKILNKDTNTYVDSIKIEKDWSHLSASDGNISTKITLDEHYDIIFDVPSLEGLPPSKEFPLLDSIQIKFYGHNSSDNKTILIPNPDDPTQTVENSLPKVKLNVDRISVIN